MGLRDDQVAVPSMPKRQCFSANNKRPLTIEGLEEEAYNPISDSGSEFQLSDKDARYLDYFSSNASTTDNTEGKWVTIMVLITCREE